MSPLTYADLADLSLASRIAAQIRIRSADAVKTDPASSISPSRKRYLISAEVIALIRGEGGLVPRITFLADVAPDSRGKFPKLAKAQMLVFAVPVAGQPSVIRLVSLDAMTPATPDAVARTRSILSAAIAVDAPPAVTGVGDAYHVAGTVAGEGETQIFLDTAKNVPISMSLVRSNGLKPAWSVALGELVDQGAPPPARDTFLWYRLACFLPRQLPMSSTEALGADDAMAARRDYATIIADMGNCVRTVKRPG